MSTGHDKRRFLIRLLAVVGLCVLPAVGWSAHPFLHNGPGGTLTPGDPTGGDRFSEEIPAGGGGAVIQSPTLAGDPVFVVPVQWPVSVPLLPVWVPGQGLVLVEPSWQRQVMTKSITINIAPERSSR